MNRSRGELEVFEDPSAVARAGAERFAAAAERAIAASGRFAVALAGGSTPRATYQILAQAFRDLIAWEKVEIFFGDERCVPPEHPDSNYRMAREALLDRVPLAADHVHRIPGELPPEEAARDYQATLERVLGPAPRFDLVLLGMGKDGHTASLFPGTTALAEREKKVAAVHVTQLDTWRVTLTAPVLCAAAEVVVMTVGDEKADALALALDGPDGAVPIQLVRPTSGKMAWLVDRAAAARLRPGM